MILSPSKKILFWACLSNKGGSTPYRCQEIPQKGGLKSGIFDKSKNLEFFKIQFNV